MSVSVWGSFILDVFTRPEAGEVRDALEDLLGPESFSAWSTGGVYVFWDPETREPLYIGITGDLPVRFTQHLGLRSSRAEGCKREQIAAYFDEGHEHLGYTVITLSSLSQPPTARQRASLTLEQRDLIELSEAAGNEAMGEARGLEGRLIAAHQVKTGSFPRWNEDPGRVPPVMPGAGDVTLAVATGEIDLLLQARRTIRQIAADASAAFFEEHLHAVRMLAVGKVALGSILSDQTLRDDILSFPASTEIRDEILRSGYLDQPCPVAAGKSRPRL